MSTATMTLEELETHGRRLAAALDNPPSHFCTNPDACAAFDAARAALIGDLAAARAEWLTRKNTSKIPCGTR